MPDPTEVARQERLERRREKRKQKRESQMARGERGFNMRPTDRQSQGERTRSRDRSGPVRTQTVLGAGEDPTERRPENQSRRRRRRPAATQTTMSKADRLG